MPFPPADLMAADGTAGTEEQQDHHYNSTAKAHGQEKERITELVQSQEHDSHSSQYKLRDAPDLPRPCFLGQFRMGKPGTAPVFLKIMLQQKDLHEVMSTQLAVSSGASSSAVASSNREAGT